MLNRKATVSLILRCAVASIFLTAAIGKLFDIEEFVGAVEKLKWLPEALSRPFAIILLVAECVVGLLLLSRHGIRAGAMIGGLLSIGFIGVTSHLIASGIPEGCPCFGIFLKLPTSAMLSIDLFLALACLILLKLQPNNERSDSGEARKLQNGTDKRQWLAPTLVTVYVVLISSLLQSGFAIQKHRFDSADRRTIKLRYGDTAPYFSSVSNSGSLVSTASLRSKWTLLCFVLPNCKSCEAELGEIVSRYPTWKSQVNIVVILVGKPAFRSPNQASRDFSQRFGLPMTVICDYDQKIASRYCDQPFRAPFSVLLDADGVVRFVQDGREDGKAKLIDDIDSVLKQTLYDPEAVALESPSYGRPVYDGELLVNGRWVKLSTFWRSKPLLLAFVMKNCDPCKLEVDRLERALGNSESINVIYIYPTRKEAEDSSRNVATRGIIAADASTKVHTAYQVWNAPATFLLSKGGKLVYAPNKRSNEQELERFLRHQASLAIPSVSFRGKVSSKGDS